MDGKMVNEKVDIERQLTEYFERKYGSNATFMFSHIEYKYKYFGERSILDLNDGGRIKKVQEYIVDKALAHIPILVSENKDMSYGQFMELNSCLKVDEIIDLDTGDETAKNKLLSEIKKALPNDITIISESELDSAIKDLGYTEYEFDFENLGSLGDGRIVTKFGGEVECDYTTFPRNITNKETATMLEKLYAQHKLDFKVKKYGVGTQDKPIHTTDSFEEYTFEGKKYIRMSANISSGLKLSDGREIEEGQPYWVEVEELEKDDEKVYTIHDISEIQDIIPNRRKGQVYKVISEFMSEFEKESDEQIHEEDVTKE